MRNQKNKLKGGVVATSPTTHVRPAFFLILFFLAVSAIRFIISCPVEWIHIFDSVWYASSANSFFHSFQLLIGGRFNSGLPLYSVLISPAYFFKDMGDTFTAIKLINSLVMSSTMFPVFLLARRFMPFGWAFTVALLSVLTGSMFYTFTIMTENLHYPLSMWVIYLMYLSLIRESRWIKLILGFFFGLALLNKMSSLALFVCYIILIGFSPGISGNLGFMKRFPISYLRALLRYRHVFIALAITILPYVVYRIIARENSPAVPYTLEWLRFSSNILDFDVIKYLKWFLTYLGQLNLSTGLFLFPLSTFMIISLCRSDRSEDRMFGLSAVILMAGVLALAVLQSGYNLERLTERHFFILTPLIFILSFLWLRGEVNRVPKILRWCIGFAAIVASGFALFVPSETHGPAVDSAFIDALNPSIHFATWQGISAVTVKLIILLISSLLIVYSGFFKRRIGCRTAVVVLFGFMFFITVLCYFQAIRHLEWVKRMRSPVTSWISKSISSPANLVFLIVPRSLAIDHIIWNKDRDNKIYWQAREQLGNASKFKFYDYIKLKGNLNDIIPTYIISPFFTYSGANLVGHKNGIEIFESGHPERVMIKDFHVDFGAPYSHQVLKKGWSGNEGSFVRAVGTQSEMDVYTESVKSGKTLVFKARPYPADQSVKVILNGENIGTIVMQPSWHKYKLQIDPRHLKSGKNSVTFKFRHAESPSESGGQDTRKLAAAFDWLRLEDEHSMKDVSPIIYVEPAGNCGDKTPCYASLKEAMRYAPLKEAISGVVGPGIIRIAQGAYDEDIILDEPKELFLQGGWDSSFTSRLSTSTINSMRISSGTVTTEYLVIQLFTHAKPQSRKDKNYD